MKISVKIPNLKKMGLTPRQIDEAAKILLDDLKQTVPVDSGTLQRNIFKKKTPNGVELYIRGKRNNEVAGYLIQGTDDHFIKPKGDRTFSRSGSVLKKPSKRKISARNRNKTILAWQGAGGIWHYSKGHMVSGIRKGYWKFKIRKRAMDSFLSRIKTFLKAK